MLSLKRRVFANYSGQEANKYVKKALNLGGNHVKADFDLKKFLGGEFIKIDDVRIEIGIPRKAGDIFPRSHVNVFPLVYPEIKIEPVNALVTDKEFIMALKVYKLGKEFTEEEEGFALTDFIRSICDLWSCSSDYDFQKLKHYFGDVCLLKTEKSASTAVSAYNRINRLANYSRALEWFQRSGQTSLLARSNNFEQLCNSATDVVKHLIV